MVNTPFQKGPKSFRKKPLGQWPDSKKHQGTMSPQEESEQSRSGHMPDPEEVIEKDTLEAAQEVGLYGEADEEHPKEVDIGQQVNEAEDRRKPGHGSE